jgi:hypothetical protein
VNWAIYFCGCSKRRSEVVPALAKRCPLTMLWNSTLLWCIITGALKYLTYESVLDEKLLPTMASDTGTYHWLYQARIWNCSLNAVSLFVHFGSFFVDCKRHAQLFTVMVRTEAPSKSHTYLERTFRTCIESLGYAKCLLGYYPCKASVCPQVGGVCDREVGSLGS